MEIFWTIIHLMIGMCVMCIIYLTLPYWLTRQLYQRIFDTSHIRYVEKYIYSKKQNCVFAPFRCTVKDLLELNAKTHIIHGGLLWSLIGQDVDSSNCHLIITDNLHLHYRYKGSHPVNDKIIPQNAEMLIFPQHEDTQG